MRVPLLRLLSASFLSLTMAACGSGGSSTSGVPAVASQSPADPIPVTLGLQTVATNLDSPVFLTALAADTRLFIVERAGRIRVLQNGAPLAAPFLDISDRVSIAGEGGLLSMAFDPNYAANGFFYIYYTDTNGDIAIERFQVSGNPNVADEGSQLRILSIPHPNFTNHYGGLLTFGPDGLLYLGTGDGGGSGDPNANGQNTNSLLGKLLRIDVAAGTAAVPSTNPFAGQPGRRGEIWAYGLRNPWRFAFDSETGLLYIADVGELQREEVNVVAQNQAGLNFGWDILEGTVCFAAATCNPQGFVPPVLEYGHEANDSGGCAIIGGYVYRGNAIPELRGSYLYTDLCSGRLKSFAYTNGAATRQTDFGRPDVGTIQSFGQDAQNELYLLSDNGNVYRIIRQ